MALSLIINGKEAALKKGASIEYVSENRIFTDADDYSMEIELPLAGCQQNIDIFGMLTRKDIDADTIFFDMFRIHQLDKEARYFNMPYEDQKRWFQQWNPTD